MRYFFSSLLILAIIIVSSLISFLTPWGLDDWTFVAEWRDIVGEHFNFSSLYSFWADIRLYDNGRFSNTLVPVFLLYSPWKELFPLLTGVSIAIIVRSISRFSFYKYSFSAFSLSIVWAVVIFMLPWRSGLFIADYSINYIWSAALTLLFIEFVMKSERDGWGVGRNIIALLLAFIAGGWHEGFALPAVLGLFIYTIQCHRKFSFQWWVVGVFYAGVAVANYLCPGMLERTSSEFGVQRAEFSLLKTIIDFIPVVLLIIILVTISLTHAGRHRIRKVWGDPWFIISSGVVFVGVILSLVFIHQPRSAFWPDIMAIVMMFILTRPIWYRIYNSIFRWYVVLLFLAMTFVPLLFAISEQYQYYREAKEIEKLMLKSETGTVFYDTREPGISSLLTLKIPTHALWKTAYHYESIQNYTRKPTAAVVPRELGINEWRVKSQEIPGTTSFYKVGNSLILPESSASVPAHVEYPLITLKNGYKVQGVALFLPYITAEGEECTYVKIYNVPLEEISEIRLPD